jgi:hypothetical protein
MGLIRAVNLLVTAYTWVNHAFKLVKMWSRPFF